MIEQHTAHTTGERPVNRRHQLRKAYHGKVLPTIARQCPIRMPNGKGFFALSVAVAAWKEKYRELFHPGRSTEDMDDDEFALLILRVEAFAAMRQGVEFPSDRGAH